jgi:hypothetical protein
MDVHGILPKSSRLIGWQFLDFYQAQAEDLFVDNGHGLHLRFDSRPFMEGGKGPFGQYEDFPAVVAQGITLELKQGDFGDPRDLASDLDRFSFKAARTLENLSYWRVAEWEIVTTGEDEQKAKAKDDAPSVPHGKTPVCLEKADYFWPQRFGLAVLPGIINLRPPL